MEETKEELTKLLVDRVLKNDHTKFEFLRSLDELATAKKCKKAIKNVSNGFYKTSKKIFKTYLRNIKTDEDNIELLLSYKHVVDCANFYKQDAKIVGDMISEYKCYLKYGHLFKSIFLGYYRPEEDLTDWRKLPIGL